jgi:ankyrin repeat protein
MLDDLDQLRRQAKELRRAFVAGDAAAVVLVNARLRRADPATFRLHDAQLVLARSYGFGSWPKLKAHVDRFTVTRLADAVNAGDVARVVAMLDARPELVRMHVSSGDERQVLHLAVLERSTEMMRVLMRHGANPHAGIYPHRDATGALTLAAERGYDDIVAVIEAEDRSDPHVAHEVVRVQAAQGDDAAACAAAREAVASGDGSAVADLHAKGLLSSCIEPAGGLLSVAVQHDRPEILALLMQLGFEPNERARVDDLDEEVETWGMPLWHAAGDAKYAMAEMLLEHGADPNGRVYASGSPVFQAYSRRDWRWRRSSHVSAAPPKPRRWGCTVRRRWRSRCSPVR